MTDDQLVATILKISQTLAGMEFYAFQAIIATRVIESVIKRDIATITSLVSRQAGKTEIVARIIVGLIVLLPYLAKVFPGDPRLTRFAGGFFVFIFGPEESKAYLPFDRARDQLNSEACEKILTSPSFKKAFGPQGIYLVTNKVGHLKLNNGSVLRAQSASKNTNNEGYTAHLVVLEETQAISEYKIEKEIAPTMTNTYGTMVAIGTANAVHGAFKSMIMLNEESYQKGGKKNHFEYDWEVVVQNRNEMYEREKRQGKTPNEGHKSYEAVVRKKIADLVAGEENPEFQMNFRLKWKEFGSGAIDKPSWYANARKDRELGQRIYPGYQVVALDVGHTGDSSWCTVVDVDWENPIVTPAHLLMDGDQALTYRKAVTDYKTFLGNFEDNPQTGYKGQYDRLFNFLRGKTPGILLVDTTGIGQAVYERCKVLAGDSFAVEPFKFSRTSKPAIYKAYLDEIEAGRWNYPAGTVTRQMDVYKQYDEQHCNLLKLVDEEKKTISYEAPPKQKDDAPDSGALANHAVSLVSALIMPYIDVRSVSSVFGEARSGRGGNQHSSSESTFTNYRRGRLVMSSTKQKTLLHSGDFGGLPLSKEQRRKFIAHVSAAKFDLTTNADGSQLGVADHTGEVLDVVLCSSTVGGGMTINVLVDGVPILAGGVAFTHSASYPANIPVHLPLLAAGARIKAGQTITVTRGAFTAGASSVKVVYASHNHLPALWPLRTVGIA